MNARSRRQLADDLAKERRRREQISDRDALVSVLASLDVSTYLLAGGLDEDDLWAVRERMVQTALRT